MTHRAKRVFRGYYEYRGFTIEHNEFSEGAWDRWAVRSDTDDWFCELRETKRDCMSLVDFLLDSEYSAMRGE